MLASSPEAVVVVAAAANLWQGQQFWKGATTANLPLVRQGRRCGRALPSQLAQQIGRKANISTMANEMNDMKHHLQIPERKVSQLPTPAPGMVQAWVAKKLSNVTF